MKKSLASATLPVPVDAPQLPALPQAGECDVNTTGVGGTPYVFFGSPKSAKWADYVAALPGLQAGNPVLSLPEGPVRLAPFRFFLLRAKQYWAALSDSNEILQASFVEVGDNNQLKEAVESVLLVFSGDNLVPARCTFRTVKCPAIKAAVKALAQAASPEWAKRGPDYAASLAVKEPYARFTTTVAVTTRTARSSGFRYELADGKPHPVSVGDIAALDRLYKSDDMLALLNRVNQAFDRRVAEIAAKV